MPHAITVRLSEALYKEARSVSRRRNVSFNALVEQVLLKEIASEQEREMYEAATLLGSDPDSDVGFAFAAQAEVALRD